MDKTVSIVRVDTRPYRRIAQDNWGLTNAQMRGKHVHHRIAVSDGGTNDPSNLYVCSPSFHRWGWHNGEKFVEWANKGAEKANEHKNEEGKSILGAENAKRLNSEKDENGKSMNAVKGSAKAHAEKNEEGKSVTAVKAGKAAAKKLHEAKTEDGKSVVGVNWGKKMAKKLTGEIWESLIDGFRSNAGNVVRHNKANGWDPDARVKIS